MTKHLPHTFNRKNTFYSLHFPGSKFVHYSNGQKIGESRLGYCKSYTHYNTTNQLIARTIPSFFGEPNHYALNGRCIGFSRWVNPWKIRHYNELGENIGSSTVWLGTFYCHHFHFRNHILFRNRQAKHRNSSNDTHQASSSVGVVVR